MAEGEIRTYIRDRKRETRFAWEPTPTIATEKKPHFKKKKETVIYISTYIKTRSEIF